MAPETVRVGTFGGASAFPLLVARSLGRFDAAGLLVELETTADSGALRAGLAAGRLQVVHLAPDNVLAWRDGGREPGLPVRAWLAGSNGPISLVAREADRVAGLEGARIGVDAVGSGFVPILRRLLERGGVAPEAVTLVPLGATRRRAEALAAGSIDATMLTLPWSLLARSAGARVLDDHRSVAPDLLTSCGAALEPWLAADGGAVARRYAGALDEALAWLRDPANHGQAAGWLAEDVDVPDDIAASVLATMLDPEAGWPAASALRSGALDVAWRLRAEAVGSPAAEPEAYRWPAP